MYITIFNKNNNDLIASINTDNRETIIDKEYDIDMLVGVAPKMYEVDGRIKHYKTFVLRPERRW